MTFSIVHRKHVTRSLGLGFVIFPKHGPLNESISTILSPIIDPGSNIYKRTCSPNNFAVQHEIGKVSITQFK